METTIFFVLAFLLIDHDCVLAIRRGNNARAHATLPSLTAVCELVVFQDLDGSFVKTTWATLIACRVLSCTAGLNCKRAKPSATRKHILAVRATSLRTGYGMLGKPRSNTLKVARMFLSCPMRIDWRRGRR